MNDGLLDLFKVLLVALVGGAPVAGWIALRKDRREKPKDDVDTFRKAMELSGEAATAAIAANANSAAANSQASAAVAEAAQARADVAKVRSELNDATAHSGRQDIELGALRTELDIVKRRLKAYVAWANKVHDEWSSLREHMTPPPLPEND